MIGGAKEAISENPLQLHQTYLHKRSLNLSIRTSPLTKPPPSNRVNLIHEDNTRFMFSRIGEHLSDQSRGFTDIFVDNLCQREKSGRGRSKEHN
jgi:hypothetical protein